MLLVLVTLTTPFAGSKDVEFGNSGDTPRKSLEVAPGGPNVVYEMGTEDVIVTACQAVRVSHAAPPLEITAQRIGVMRQAGSVWKRQLISLLSTQVTTTYLDGRTVKEKL